MQQQKKIIDFVSVLKVLKVLKKGGSKAVGRSQVVTNASLDH